MEEVVELYSTAPPPAKASNEEEKVVKIVGPQKRSFFNPDEQRNISIGMSKLPRPDVIKEAAISYNTKAMSNEQVDTLCRIWPTESSVGDLA